MKALLLIDIQNDFLPGGALEVKSGNDILPIINNLQKVFHNIVATKDWHPQNHKSFADNHQGKKPGDVILLGGLDQILWPVHCVQHSRGAEFPEELNVSNIDQVVYKGEDPEIDSYSGFFDNGHKKKTNLDNYLKSKNIDELYLAGLATDYCVKFTALDALQLGYKVHVIVDATKAVNIQKNDFEKALDEMKSTGVNLINSSELL